MNKNRGEFDTLKLAELLQELQDEFKLDHVFLEEELGYSEQELAVLHSVLNVDIGAIQAESDGMEVPAQEDDPNLLPVTFTETLTYEQSTAIEEAMALTQEPNRGEALTLICKDFSHRNKSKAKADVQHELSAYKSSPDELLTKAVEENGIEGEQESNTEKEPVTNSPKPVTNPSETPSEETKPVTKSEEPTPEVVSKETVLDPTETASTSQKPVPSIRDL